MRLRDLDLQYYYSTSSENIVDELYRPCLQNSSFYRRGVGYFRSSVFNLMTPDLVDFCLNGGKIEILTSTDVDPLDHEAVLEGYSLKSFYLTLEQMLAEEEIQTTTRLLCALVATGHLAIKVAKVPNGGIYHDKVGYFKDGDNTIVFSGSGNETYTALRGMGGNHETFNVIWDWDDTWTIHGEKWARGLDDAIEGKNPNLEIIDVTELDLDFIEKHSISLDLEGYLEEIFSRPTNLPDLRAHQIEGLKKWKENGRKGILKHATASGKTITSISAMEEHLEHGGNVVILVPSRLLLDQWTEEVRKYIPDAIVGKVGAGKKDIDILNMMIRNRSDQLILIATIKSASKGKFLRLFNRVVEGSDLEVLFIVDECHNIGAEGCSDLCKVRVSFSLGLSATPERMGDGHGTQRMFNLLGPVIHEFSIWHALKHEPPLLTPYEYHIHTVELLPEEQLEFDELKSKIAKLYAIWNNAEEAEKKRIKNSLDLLNFKARRIIRGATNKLEKMKEIVSNNYQSNQHWIVYCDSEKMLLNAEEKIRELGIVPSIYHSKMNQFSRSKTLSNFERDGGLLLAIRCLDEGVNIPCISHGMVLSSTTNPREFIQRRGRMLRRFPGKEQAEIFDTFALPADLAENTGFLMSEIIRAKDLAEDSLNKNTNIIEVNMLIRKYDISIVPEFEEEVVFDD